MSCASLADAGGFPGGSMSWGLSLADAGGFPGGSMSWGMSLADAAGLPGGWELCSLLTLWIRL